VVYNLEVVNIVDSGQAAKQIEFELSPRFEAFADI